MKDLITIAAEEFIDKWNKANKTNISYIPNKFDLTGRTAGQFWHNSTTCWFRWNLPLAIKNDNDYLINTVGHEVAHLITHKTYPGATPHGYEWKFIMQQLGLEPARCHNYKTIPARVVSRPYKYICPCGIKHSYTIKKLQNILLSKITKNGNSQYFCKKCKTLINIKNIKINNISILSL